MPQPVDCIALGQDRIHKCLKTTVFGRTLWVLPEVSSTNAHALTLIDSGSAHGTLVAAERQTAGRGRLDRTWFSPPTYNLYASLLLSLPQGFSLLSWLPLIAGLALTEAIHHVCGIQATLKWPNDLLIKEKKAGGILCEGNSQGFRHQWVVIGMGLNVNMSESDFPDTLRPHSTSLRIQTGSVTDRNQLLAQILNYLEVWYDKLTKDPINTIHSAYTARCGTLGRQLMVALTNGERYEAFGRAIGEDGSLLVSLGPSSEASLRRIHSGEVTHLNIIGS